MKKQVGLFEIESINKANVLTVALNPKEYYERLEDHPENKKHKGLKKSTSSMDFDSYSSRLEDLNEFSKKNLKIQRKSNRKDFRLLTNQCK